MSIALSDAFPERARDMARLGGLTFFGELPEIVGRDPVMRFPRPLGEAAAAAIALTGDGAAEIWRRRTGLAQRPRVEVRRAAAALAGFAFQMPALDARLSPEDWEPEPDGWRAWGARSMLRGENAGNPAVGIYRCRDGRWIHLHGGLPHLAERLMTVLRTDVSGIPAAAESWRSAALEEAVAEAGGCAAIVRGTDEWRAHAQGRALASLPVIEVLRIGDGPRRPLPTGEGPLAGLRVLDLSVALAGPTCARTLAEHGADVLRIDAPGRTTREPFLIETGHGKRATFLDLKSASGREALAGLIGEADVFCQSYRRGALERLGFGPPQTAALRPGIVHVSVNCYGHVGPWADRRGWEGLAQAATGLTIGRGADLPPRLAPCSVCDYLTGYLAARGVMEALLRRRDEGGTWHVRASLCQTGMWLAGMGRLPDETPADVEPDLFDDLLIERETPFGRLRHLPPVLGLPRTSPHWRHPPPRAGQGGPVWHPRAWPPLADLQGDR